ncbi:hypothetical protein [Cupriavidus consociatus]|uniref:hypothetical protein n=1 Tax=Cupriavidus consociatus TaxID=2821357 RepID=UPI001AE7460B|nr:MULTISPECIES: hypothetical protein [unclassified Cupriavidus]MBP0623278.1 hypothetical protein [Cupriavidus sp. LEh25]MDK2659971.1 hypothetical protein [Cupriavidus sp. LEh21]
MLSHQTLQLGFGYRDYRGRRVAGAGLWVPALASGLIEAAEPGTPPPAEPPRAAPGPGWSLPQRRVLLVEDNEINREVAVHLLQQARITPGTAGNGRVALERLATRRMTWC